MIRGFLIGIVRIIFWLFAFTLVTTIARSVLRIFNPKPRTKDEVPQGPPTSSTKSVEEYKDVRDADFKEVKE